MSADRISKAEKPKMLARRVEIQSLPLIRGYGTRWRGVIYANSAVRREAKAMLFAELAESIRQGVPIEKALDLASRSVEEYRLSGTKAQYGANTRYPWLNVVLTFAYLLLLEIPLFLYAFFAFRMADVERVSRLLAVRLLHFVKMGMALSLAMRRCELDYYPEEVAMVQQGEAAGDLPGALKMLAEFQSAQGRLSIQAMQAVYPLAFWLLIYIVAAVAWSVAARFLRSQNGFVSHAIESLFSTTLSGLLTRDVLIVMGIPLGLLLLFMFARAMMNGTSLGKLLTLGVNVIIVVLAILRLAMSLSPDKLDAALPFVFLAGCVGLLITIYGAPASLYWLETLVVWMERMVRPVARHVPMVGQAARAQTDAIWLASLAMLLKGGATAPEALECAGRTAGLGYCKRSNAAANMVRSGRSIGEACVEQRVLAHTTNHRLMLIDWRRDFLDGLRDVAADAAQEANEKMLRTGRIMETFAIIITPIAMFFVISALYQPIIDFPREIIKGMND